MGYLATFAFGLIAIVALPAFATPLNLVPPAPHGPGPGAATISILVELSDGFTTTTIQGQVLLAADGVALWPNLNASAVAAENDPLNTCTGAVFRSIGITICVVNVSTR